MPHLITAASRTFTSLKAGVYLPGLLVLAGLLLGSSSALADVQAVGKKPLTYEYDVVPGSTQIDTSRLQNYSATWQQLVRSEDGLVDSGARFEETLVITPDSILHTQVVHAPNDLTITEKRSFDPVTLRPAHLKHTKINAPSGRPVKVEVTRADTGWAGVATLDDGSESPFEYTEETEAFDGWVAGLALASLPLAVGYEARLPAVVQFQKATYLLHAKVREQRDEIINAENTIPVWVVDTGWINVADNTESPAGADKSGGSYLIAVNPESGQPHVIEYANDGAIIRWKP